MPLVFQYGSNCLEKRLNSPERLNGGARYDGRAQTVDQYEIVFDVWSRGNGCAAADLRAEETREQHVWGVLYQVTDEGFRRLRQVEGPRYQEMSIRVRNLLGEIKHAKTFLVRAREREQALWTSANYVGYIVNGLRNHQVPEEYVQHVIDIAIRTNDDAGTKILLGPSCCFLKRCERNKDSNPPVRQFWNLNLKSNMRSTHKTEI